MNWNSTTRREHGRERRRDDEIADADDDIGVVSRSGVSVRRGLEADECNVSITALRAPS